MGPSPAIEQGSYNMEGADTSLVEAAAIASRELKEEEEKPETEIILKPETEIVLKPETETILKPEPETPALSTQQPSAELEPAFIHSDDDPSKEDDDNDDKIPSTKDDFPRSKQHDEDSDSNEE